MIISNRIQFVCRRIAVLMVCGLTTGLLPQRLQAQQVTEAEIQTRITGMVSRATNANISPATATNDPVLRYDREQLGALIGRLMQLTPDPAALQALSEWYNIYPRGDMFNHYSTAFAVNKWWEFLTTAQQENIRDNMSKIGDWIGLGTPNHQIMRNVGGALYGQLWPNDAVFNIGGQGVKTGQEVVDAVKPRLLAISKNLYSRGEYEHMSPTYLAVHIGPWAALYDQTNDPELKAAADAALRYFATTLASSHLYGQHVGPHSRENVTQRAMYANGGTGGTNVTSSQRIAWLWWGDNSRNLVGAWDARRVGGPAYITAASSWRPHAAINRIALGTEPLSSRGCRPNSSHAGGLIAQSSAYEAPGINAYSLPHAYNNFQGLFNFTWYKEERFAVGSQWANWDPDETYGQVTGTGIIYNVSGNKGLQAIDICHPYHRMTRQSGQGDFYARFSPFEGTSQHQNTLISLFNIPTDDPWPARGRGDFQGHRSSPLIQEARLRYPDTRDQVVEANGWVFIRDGEVYFAIRPLSSYTINTNTPTGRGPGPFGNSNTHFHVIETPGPRTGFIVDVVTASEFTSFEAFRTAVLAQPLTIDLATPSASYQSVRGHTIAANWVPVDYTYTGIPPNVQPDRIRVRNNLIVNGQTVPADETYPVLVNDYVDCQDYQMAVSTPAGDFIVDWRGDYPIITEHVNYYAVQLEFTDSVSGETIEGLEVILHGSKYITDAQGMISIPSIPGGTYTLAFTDNGLFTENPTIEIRSDSLFRIQVKELVTTMVQKKTGDNHFFVYPNPAYDYLVIDKKIPVAKPVKIDLVNVSGISLYSAQDITLPYTLRLKEINPGIYFLKIHSPEGFANQIITVK